METVSPIDRAAWQRYRIVDVLDKGAGYENRERCSHCGTDIRYVIVISDGTNRRGIGSQCASKVGLPEAHLTDSMIRDARYRRTAAARAEAVWRANVQQWEHLEEIEAALIAASEAADARIISETAALSGDDLWTFETAAREAYLPFPAYILDIVSKLHQYEISYRQYEVLVDAWGNTQVFDLASTPAPSIADWLGSVGEKLTVSGTVVRQVVGEPFAYGAAAPLLVVVETAEGHTVTTWTTAKWSDDIENGQAITIAGTVKKHDIYSGVKQTVLTRTKRLA